MKIVIAGGGTGGHIFPGIALAQALQEQDKNIELFFIGAQRGLERVLVPKAGYRLELLEIAGLNHVSWRQKFKTLWLLPKAFLRSMALLKQEKVDVVIGIGGYASGPAVLAAFFLGIPSAICEPNSVPGLTNRILGRFCKRVYGAFAYAAPYFPRRKWVLSGTPVRRELLETFLAVPVHKNSQPNNLRLLVLGGSQGARFLNENLPEAAGVLRQAGIQLEVLHQSGPKEVESVHKAYRHHGIEADVRPFIDEMAKAYAWADVAVCRAGAGTCTELCLMGVPSVLIPFPLAADDHQTLNGRELQESGACVLIQQKESNAHILAQHLLELARSPQKRVEMAQKAKKLAHPQAAKNIAQDACKAFVT